MIVVPDEPARVFVSEQDFWGTKTVTRYNMEIARVTVIFDS